MTSQLLKTFKGFSGSEIHLMNGAHGLFVRKIGNVERNVERMQALNHKYTVPKIYSHNDNVLDMEYIHGLDIKTYLKSNQPNELLKFLSQLMDSFKQHSQVRDYTDVYIKKLNGLELCNELPFTREELLDKLPKEIPTSNYCGDLTLENIIYTQDRGFVIIDCVQTEFDSYVFDICKLRQDLELSWFTRNTDLVLDVKTKYIQQELLKRYPEANNNYLLILMLLRVYRHSKPGSYERKFLIQGINRLWK